MDDLRLTNTSAAGRRQWGLGWRGVFNLGGNPSLLVRGHVHLVLVRERWVVFYTLAPAQVVSG